jgi:hypothetical protein
VSAGRGWFVAGAVLAVASLGLPWTGELSGAAHPARVAVVAGLVLAVAGLRSGRDRLLTAAVVVGGLGVLIGGVEPAPGRLALAAAVGCLVLGCRAAGRRLLPGRTVRNPAR